MQALLKEYGVGKRNPNDQFFEEGDKLCKPLKREGIFDIDDEDLCHPVVEKFSCTVPCCKEMKSILEFETHYNSVHRYMCVVCKKYLPTPHLLDLHVAETHDSFFQTLAERQPMYQCYVESCTEKFMDPPSRHIHCIEVHKYPPNFRYGTGRRQRPQGAPVPGRSDADMVCDCEADTANQKQKKGKPGKKKTAGLLGPKHGMGCEWYERSARSTRGGALERKEFVTELRDSLPE